MFTVRVVYFDVALATEAMAGGVSPSFAPTMGRVEFTRDYPTKIDAEYAAKELRRDFPGSAVTVEEVIW